MNHFSFVSRTNKTVAFGQTRGNWDSDQMKSAVLLSNNYFLALAFLFVGWTPDETVSCDTKWIRLVYMMSCGKKKRESVWTTQNNSTFYEDLPPDFEGAFRYFKEKDPSNPMLDDSLLREILKEDAVSRVHKQIPKLLIYDEENNEKDSGGEAAASVQTSKKTAKPDSVLLSKLFPKVTSNHRLGIQGFPEQWDIEEVLEEKINENHRREIDRLIEECCKVPPVRACNGNTFSGACK